MKLINTKDYLLLVDEEAEIREDDWILYNNIPCKVCSSKNWRIPVGLMIHTNYRHIKLSKNANKIIAYYPLSKEAKELDLPLLPNPFEEIDIDIISWREAKNIFKENIGRVPNVNIEQDLLVVSSIQEGYKAAQSDKSLELLKNLVENIELFFSYEVANKNKNFREAKNYIQSLSTQQLPKEFIPEYIKPHESEDWKATLLPQQWKTNIKTITNSEDKQELVGIYKYK